MQPFNELFYFVGYNPSLSSDNHQRRRNSNTVYNIVEIVDKVHSIFHVIGYFPLIGAISTIVELYVFKHLYRERGNDHFYSLLNGKEKLSLAVRSGAQLASCGWLYLIPDIFVTCVRSLDYWMSSKQ